MLWLHRLQQRLSLTRNEAVTILSLCGLLSLGLVVRSIQQHARPIPPDAYEEVDRLFAELSRDLDSEPADTARAERALVPEESESANPGPSQRPTKTTPLDLNRATAAELEELPRIGPKTAENILAFRKAYGPFSSVDDLIGVRGIGPKTLALLKPLLFVSPRMPADST